MNTEQIKARAAQVAPDPHDMLSDLQSLGNGMMTESAFIKSYSNAIRSGIEKALLSMLPPPGSVLTPDGSVRRVPMTADGVLIVEPAEVWWWDGNVLLGGGAAMKMELVFCDPNDPDLHFTPNAGIGACYSTREAAQAARTEVGRG